MTRSLLLTLLIGAALGCGDDVEEAASPVDAAASDAADIAASDTPAAPQDLGADPPDVPADDLSEAGTALPDAPQEVAAPTDTAETGDTAMDVGTPDEGPELPVDPVLDCPDPITTLGAQEATSDPLCAWSQDVVGALGPDGYAVLTGVDAGCLVVAALSSAPGGEPTTIEWREHRATAIFATHEVQVDGETVYTVFASASKAPRYRHLTLDDPPAGPTFELRMCASSATEDERWEVDDIQAVAGLPPELGTGTLLPVIKLSMDAGSVKQLPVPVLDPDVQTEPFVAFPKYEVIGAPEWATVNQQSAAWDPVGLVFNNFLHLAPPEGLEGEFVFVLEVVDYQGLHDMRWLEVLVETAAE